MWPNDKKEVWWPESSYKEDSMVIGDGIPGDKESAELCARCCNIAYTQALHDIRRLFKEHGIDVSTFVSELIEKS